MFFGRAIAAAAACGLIGTAAAGWAETHMKEEHNIETFDPTSFFSLHDSDGSQTWTKQDVLNLYGLLHSMDPTGERKTPIDEDTRERVVSRIMGLIDEDGDGVISLDEWRNFNARGGELPDFGLGPGHHGDVEYEYEIHHWLKYHAEDDSDESLTHPEDIEHEKLFHSIEDKAYVDQANNIPAKFRVQA
ncbi:uncharacterized protein V1510DRAFT_404428 [Dipodascopsis tothii]|uniref:uncharacterized protein n=1 Tax=Dipodascopsis tothii TaxID=44089 RepID=UPI0034CD6D31